MRALSIRQPYASAIIFGPKRIENRTWRVNLPDGGAWIAVHASQQWYRSVDWEVLRALWPQMPDTEDIVRGAIIGTTKLEATLRKKLKAHPLGPGLLALKPPVLVDLVEHITGTKPQERNKLGLALAALVGWGWWDGEIPHRNKRTRCRAAVEVLGVTGGPELLFHMPGNKINDKLRALGHNTSGSRAVRVRKLLSGKAVPRVATSPGYIAEQASLHSSLEDHPLWPLFDQLPTPIMKRLIHFETGKRPVSIKRTELGRRWFRLHKWWGVREPSSNTKRRMKVIIEVLLHPEGPQLYFDVDPRSIEEALVGLGVVASTSHKGELIKRLLIAQEQWEAPSVDDAPEQAPAAEGANEKPLRENQPPPPVSKPAAESLDTRLQRLRDQNHEDELEAHRLGKIIEQLTERIQKRREAIELYHKAQAIEAELSEVG